MSTARSICQSLCLRYQYNTSGNTVAVSNGRPGDRARCEALSTRPRVYFGPERSAGHQLPLLLLLLSAVYVTWSAQTACRSDRGSGRPGFIVSASASVT